MRKLENVLYVVSRFPNISATFTAHEMAALAEMGITIHVAAVQHSDPAEKPHSIEQQFLTRRQGLSLRQPRVWLQAFLEILRKPALILLIVRLLIAHCINPYALAKFFICLPKGLYLGAWVRRNNIDHIHAHFLTTPTLVALLASQVSGVPYTVTIHAFDIFATSAKMRNAAVPLKCKLAAANIVISHFNETYMRQRWHGIEGRFEVIYNGIDFDLFSGAASTALANPASVHILTNGRFIPKKGHKYLIEAVALLRQKGVPVTLSLVGKGPEEAELRDLVQKWHIDDHVRFLGTINQEALVGYYRESDLFVLACAVSPEGDMDGLPTVLIKSLALGLPTISTQVSGVPEIIQDHVTGLCLPPHDPVALADAIHWMIQNPQAARELGKRGQQFVQDDFDRRKNAARLLAVWQQL